MELHPNAPVLPSNAPALPDHAIGLLPPTDLAEVLSAEVLSSEVCQSYDHGDDPSACGLPHVCVRCMRNGHPAADCECGILRASSGNVGSSVVQSCKTNLKTGKTPKYEFGPVSSLINPPDHSAQAAIKAGHPRRRQHISWSSLKGPPFYLHVEWETPRYVQYRQKIRDKGSEGEKWPDHVEEAFQLAIRYFPRRGRKKEDLNGKASGGNEFIADFIKQRTGVVRTRKQVSSHIQVLKHFLIENIAWMSLVADIKPENSTKKARGKVVAHGTLDFDDVSNYRPSQASYSALSDRPSASIDIPSSQLYQGPTIRRVSAFAMYLEDKRSKALRHTYTSIQSEKPSLANAMADINNWREMYPALAKYHDRGLIDCPMFLFDTHLSMMDHYDHPSNLAIRLSMDFRQGMQFTDWCSYPKFYEQNGRPILKFYKQNGRLVDLTGPSNIDEITQIEGTNDSRLGHIAFKSDWWAHFFCSMVSRKMKMEKSGDPGMIREEEERAIQLVEGISVMQEIWATHRGSNRGPQRMAILLWKFGVARRGETATTSWRELIPPWPAYDIQSPHPSSDNPPMTLDMNLQAASPYVAPHDPQPSIFSGCPSGDILAAPLPDDNSPSTTPTPTPDSRSFPSSASTSFPSSASNSIYPWYPSQESSFQSHESTFPSMSIIDSQESGCSLYEQREVIEASHESYGTHEFADGTQESFDSQEVIYRSQGSLYQSTPDQLYEYPYPLVDAPIMRSASQDFTGGQIQLSYAQAEDSQSSSELPLIAPQANMVPQHQLIQHPEQFDQIDYLDSIADDGSGGHDEGDEQATTQALPEAYELNGLTIDCSGWEETLRLNPDLEHHLRVNVMDDEEHIGEQCMSAVGQDTLGSPGEGVREDGEEDGMPDRQSEYR